MLETEQVQSGWLDRLERAGNALPHPATLFMIGALIVMLLSHLGGIFGWQVNKPLLQEGDLNYEPIHVVSLLNAEGLWWILKNMVENFIRFPPLGLVIVGMLGIGLAEQSGLMRAMMLRGLSNLAAWLVTPAVMFVGILSSAALDAGYLVLPPVAAVLWQLMGRPPLAGIMVAFAGVSAGFSANLVITALDPLLAGFTQAGAQFLVPEYEVAVTANWWFMIASTLVLTLVGWWVTEKIVEPRLLSQGTLDTRPASNIEITSAEQRGLRWAGGILIVVVLLLALAIFLPAGPLYGVGSRFSRWVEAMVPITMILFLLPSVAYGLGAGTIKSDKDVAKMMGDTLASLGPYIVLAFFASQFIAFFNYSNLGLMLAIKGGEWLVALEIPLTVLILAFILVSATGNLLIGSASAKYAFLAPVFVPMLMQVGISPELTQAAYRVGDSFTNVISPMNPYMVIILAFMQRYLPRAGLGTLVAGMLPYSVVFGIVWIVMIFLWMASGLPLGPGGDLWISVSP